MNATETKPIASESGHYYDAVTGEPRYTIIGKNGKERATTLRDARSLNLVPSVTTILRATLPAPGLDNWKMQQAVMAALTLPKKEGESLDDYMGRVLEDAKAQAEKAAQFGTNVHTAIERFMQGKSVEPEYEVYCISALAALEKEIPGFSIEKCEAEKSFAHPLRYGGKVDLFSRLLRFVLDFKTKAFTQADIEANKVKPYDEHLIQLPAYRVGLQMEKDTKLYNVFISTTVPGLVKIVEHPQNDKWWNVFQSLLTTWKLLKEF